MKDGIKTLNILAGLILIVTALFVVFYLTTSLYPFNVVDFYNEPVPILNPDKQVRRGDYLRLEVQFSKFWDIPANVHRSLVNDRIVTLSCETGAQRQFKPGVKKTAEICVFIPQNIWPGRYKLLTTMTYEIFGHRKIYESYESEWFEVLP